LTAGAWRRRIRFIDTPLTPQLIVLAYCQGLFPMAQGRAAHSTIDWYSPDPRAVLPLEPHDAFHISHSLRQRLRRGTYVITFDRAFAQVITACAGPRQREKSTWINGPIVEAYSALHQLGVAHSVEAWDASKEKLLGGLYGVAIGGAFFGESMFSRATDASKICLVHLVNHLRQRGYQLLDCQINNPHMSQFGVVEIPRAQYLEQLERSIRLKVEW
jgi:leucyl/phenylalanyl-tRNA---protein transferase